MTDVHDEGHQPSERYDGSKAEANLFRDEKPADCRGSTSGSETETVQKRKEELLTSLKKKRTSALSVVTKKKNEISQLMESEDNLHLVKSNFDAYCELMQRYRKAHAMFCRELQTNQQSSQHEHFKHKEDAARLFIDEVDLWIRKAEIRMQDDISTASERKSRSSSGTSRSSKVSSARVQERAKIAELMIEKSMLKHRQILKAQEEELKLEIALAKARAREQVFTAEMKETGSADEGARDVHTTETEKENDPIMLTEHLESLEHALNPNAKAFQPQTRPLPSTSNLPPSLFTTEQLLTLQKQQNDQILSANRQLASAVSLPHPELIKFSGDLLEYITFIRTFDARVVALTNNDADKLYYLEQSLQGEPRELIGGCLFMDQTEGYKQARMLLDNESGNPHKVSVAYLDKILCWPPIKGDDNSSLRKLSFFLVKCQVAMMTIEQLSALNHAPNLQAIVVKLPQYLQRKWRDKASSIHTQNMRLASFSDLVTFVKIAAESANDPIYGKDAMSKHTKSSTSKPYGQSTKKSSSSSFVANVATYKPDDSKWRPSKEKVLKCELCHGNHDLDDCTEFGKKSIDDKRSFLKDKGLCFGCYGHNHLSRGCRRKRICKKCNKPHPTALHIDGFKPPSLNPNSHSGSTQSANSTTTTEEAHSSAINTSDANDSVLHAILPVYIRQGTSSKRILTYAFYDNGSSGCFLTEELEEELSATGTNTFLQLGTMHGKTYEKTKAIQDLIVTNLDGMNEVSLPKTYSRKDIPVSHQHIPRAHTLAKWPHLKQLQYQIPEYMPDLKIGLLIGNNCPAALEPLNVMSMQNGSPYAVQLRHGWTVNGPLNISTTENQVHCHRIFPKELQPAKEIIQPAAVLEMFEQDFSEDKVFGNPNEVGLSAEDKLFLLKVGEASKNASGHYEIPLPFRDDNVNMPCNKIQAESRAKWQKQKMLRNAKYHEDYTSFVQNMISKGYAVQVTDEVTEAGRTWYLPHHGVYHHKKKDEIRIVFDCSARFGGTSLNDKLLKGPDFTNSLVGVLTRFREEEIVIIGDIEAMYHQVKVPVHQQDFLRFLWWPDGDLNNDLQEYRMAVHLFGAVSSPSVAQYALKKTAEEGTSKYGTNVAEAVRRNFYVDDCLKSVEDEETAVELSQKLCQICADGGFRLTKLNSNNKTVRSSIPEKDLATSATTHDLDYGDIYIERALGIQWAINTDTFRFSIMLESKPPTRRGILSFVSSIYDPLGLISLFILPAKRLLQALCKENDLGWDDEISAENKTKWLMWLKELPQVKNVSVPRCLKPIGFGTAVSTQLHVFSDASEVGYGAVAYLRQENERGHVYCAFIIGKARVAPIKSITIPRLELTAAVVSLKLGKAIEKELGTQPDRVVFHTDSTTVLHCVNNTKKRFPIFVSNRIQQIRDFSEPSQWRYVDTKSNPADLASRGATFAQLKETSCWFTGPSFLLKNESEWPKMPTSTVQDTVNACQAAVAVTGSDTIDKLLEHFSDWYRLKKTVAYLLRFKKYLQKKLETDLALPLSVLELNDAEMAIIKYIQRKHFSSEIDRLSNEAKRGRATSKRTLRGSSVYRLDPFLDNCGVLRVGGRLRRAKQISEEAKHPVLLLSKSPVVTLLIRSIHCKLGHAGRNHVLATLRERYWVIKSNMAVRHVLKKCIPCRQYKMPTCTQKMADLPLDRTDSSPPFTFSAVDYFGPFTIRERRKQLKRYGVLFTCLACRAIHLEIAHSLDTDSFIQALRRFIARRGPIREIRSDNGTNFVGAERELSRALEQMDQSQIKEQLLANSIDWRFNPPTASHMGGAWERQIRTVRKVLNHLTKEFGDRLDDESFSTLMCEVENIVNSRPMTTVSDDPDDLTPLNPNMILTYKSQILLPPPGQFERPDVYSRRRWHRVQYLSNLFWSRWKREYLATLQIRHKWKEGSRNVQNGDIVLLKEENLSRNEWNLGRVEEVKKDDHGHVRSAFVRTANSLLHRPIIKIVVLIPIEEQL